MPLGSGHVDAEQIVGREQNQIGCRSQDLDAYVVDRRSHFPLRYTSWWTHANSR